VAIEMQAWLQTEAMRKKNLPGDQLMHSSYADAYWTLAQLVAHHTVGGCNLRTGDLFGTGTLSSPGPGRGGSMLELTAAGKQPLTLSTGERRGFIEDGDTVILRGVCQAEGARRIGFGTCSAMVLPALPEIPA
jgi:fumarylacetoacetase